MRHCILRLERKNLPAEFIDSILDQLLRYGNNTASSILMELVTSISIWSLLKAYYRWLFVNDRYKYSHYLTLYFVNNA